MVRKALIPVAGLGTRLRPLSSVVPKCMFPLVDAAGRLRSVAHVIVAEALAGGVTDVAMVVSPGQEPMLRQYFEAARQCGDGDVPDRIEYIEQGEARGFGDAVARGAGFVGDEPFLVLLGDHVHRAAPGRPPCVAQVTGAFARHGGAAMIGMQVVGADQLALVGTARGEPLAGPLYRCTDYIEKPDLASARRRLLTPGLGEDRYLAHGGIFLFTPEIFECLAYVAAHKAPDRETELADAQLRLLERHPKDYHLLRIDGWAYDTGTPAGYAAAAAAIRANQEHGDAHAEV